MAIQPKYTRKQIHDILEKFMDDHKRLPTPQEMSELTGYAPTKCSTELSIYSKGLIMLFVHPKTKKIYTTKGETLWRQHSSGSLMPASFRDDKELGKIAY